VVQIRRTLILLLLLLCCGAVLFFGIRDYLVIAGSASLSQEELKIRSETVLFLSIVASVVIALLFALILLRSRNISRELDKITGMTRYGNFSLEESLRRIGPLGDKIRQLNERLTELNEMKALRISSLAAINSFLLNNIHLALLVTDITGKILKLTPRCLEKLKIDSGEAAGKHIAEVLPELDFQAAVARLEKQHTELVPGNLKDAPTLYPIFNSKNDLSNVICILGKEEIVTKISKYGEDRARPASRATNLVRKYFRSRRKKRSEQV